MSLPESVAVIGLGLMGGSLAKDLSAAGVRVLGYDSRAGAAEQALTQGELSGVLDEPLVGVGVADMVILATPVDVATAILRRLGPLLKPGAVVTDVGSTKARVNAAAEEAGLGEVFVGSHPLAGDHRSGWDAARSGLYRGALVYVSPTTTSSTAAIAAVEALWVGLGATCTRIDPDRHDRLMARVSHLPQVVSTAVAASLSAAGCTPEQLGPGGRDVTRLAASSPEMWTAIAMTNEPHLLDAIRTVRERLERFEQALAAGDEEAVRSFFAAGRDWSR